MVFEQAVDQYRVPRKVIKRQNARQCFQYNLPPQRFVPKSRINPESTVFSNFSHNPYVTFSKKASYNIARGLVSKETVVLRRWGRETQNFGFIN